jgi:geranylgeranyl diphosphate synthase type II
VDAEARLKTYADLADAQLQAILSTIPDEPALLAEAMRYAVLGAGKRLRPALSMSAAKAVGAPPEAGLHAGCAIELVHCFSLVHDDLPAIDNDDLRRGRPTCHVQFGEAIAILAGDGLFALAFEVLAESAPHHKAGLLAVRELARASGPHGLVGGEVEDILAEGRAVGKDEVLGIHVRKTGELIRAASEIGALYGGGTEQQIEDLARYGAHAGLAFQISDDLLNELSSPAAIGKSAGSDRERRKATYPAVFGLDTSKDLAREESEKAMASLQRFGPEADDLRLFAGFIVERLR